jgi:hypothetical protein
VVDQRLGNGIQGQTRLARKAKNGTGPLTAGSKKKDSPEAEISAPQSFRVAQTPEKTLIEAEVEREKKSLEEEFERRFEQLADTLSLPSALTSTFDRRKKELLLEQHKELLLTRQTPPQTRPARAETPPPEPLDTPDLGVGDRVLWIPEPGGKKLKGTLAFIGPVQDKLEFGNCFYGKPMPKSQGSYWTGKGGRMTEVQAGFHILNVSRVMVSSPFLSGWSY